MGPYKSLCVLIGPYGFFLLFWALMDSNGSLKVLNHSYWFKWVPIRSLCVLMSPYEFL